ncbi:flippase [Marinomonas posidonica]|uniref:Polysaccharide biosynthesis protein n=1 Tax=Marinomonas posidonica (strain CECT 7376 / NCIMB 14433 / IVIA-Po-181) TaxID=491952 RepID=F6CZP9_MARPP|nr:flippase [Marinomonas posidonica]AEF53560.1 polysaccharide biosynthesis protein [Marinomonas posidonica IVIA-Po-181]
MSFAKTENKTFLANASFLALMQAVNSFLPLLTVPFLVRVLGVELFGKLAFATALMYYFFVLTDYGFNLTATRDISINRSDIHRVKEIYTCVFFIKAVLIGVSFLILMAVFFFFPTYIKNWPLYLFSFFAIVWQSFFPTWFFQGMEKMKYITYLSVLSKILFTVGIFAFVQGPEDYLLVPILTALGFFFSSSYALYLIHHQHGVSFVLVPWSLVRKNIIDGWYVFLSQMKITLFSSTNVVMLGAMTGPIAVGYYVAAEKIMRALALAQTPITGALFPLIANKMKKDKALAIKKLKNIAYLGSTFYLCVFGIGYFLSDYVIALLYGDELQESAWALKVMLIIPLLIFLNNIFGTQILLNTGREKLFFYVLLLAAILSLVLCFSLTYLYSYQGTVIALLVTEVFVVLAFFVLVYKDWVHA